MAAWGTGERRRRWSAPDAGASSYWARSVEDNQVFKETAGLQQRGGAGDLQLKKGKAQPFPPERFPFCYVWPPKIWALDLGLAS